MKEEKIKGVDWLSIEDLGSIYIARDSRGQSVEGVVYIIGYGDNVKIGSAFVDRAQKRVNEVIRVLNYGVNEEYPIHGVLCTPPHGNFRASEGFLKQHFDAYRIESTECFGIPYRDIVKMLPDVCAEVYEDSDYVFEDFGVDYVSKSLLKLGKIKSMGNDNDIVDILDKEADKLANEVFVQCESMNEILKRVEKINEGYKLVCDKYFSLISFLRDNFPEALESAQCFAKYTKRKREGQVKKAKPRHHNWSEIHNDFKVGQYRLTGELIDVHDGIRGASEKTGVSYPNIWANVMGQTKKSHGYIWAKCDEGGVPLTSLRIARYRVNNEVVEPCKELG